MRVNCGGDWVEKRGVLWGRNGVALWCSKDLVIIESGLMSKPQTSELRS